MSSTCPLCSVHVTYSLIYHVTSIILSNTSTNPLTYPLTRPLTYHLTYPLTRPVTYPLTHSLTYPLIRPLTHPLTHPLLHHLTHFLTLAGEFTGEKNTLSPANFFRILTIVSAIELLPISIALEGYKIRRYNFSLLAQP